MLQRSRARATSEVFQSGSCTIPQDAQKCASTTGAWGELATFRSRLNSTLREIRLNEGAQLGRDLRTSAEPKFEAAHRLMQQHPQAVSSFEASRPCCC